MGIRDKPIAPRGDSLQQARQHLAGAELKEPVNTCTGHEGGRTRAWLKSN